MINQIENVSFTNPDGSVCESVVIIYDDGSQVSMLKSTYDAQIEAQSTLPSNSSTPQVKRWGSSAVLGW
jgi:hypothetical protein